MIGHGDADNCGIVEDHVEFGLVFVVSTQADSFACDVARVVFSVRHRTETVDILGQMRMVLRELLGELVALIENLRFCLFRLEVGFNF